jgi:hypothetical protein
MAKDPAFLFYSADFLIGTQFMTDDQVGKYIRLLCYQHQHGKLSEKHMLFICKTYDVEIFGKFTKDSTGLYYNEKLENEIIRRKKYSESRSKNRTNEKTYVPHMVTEAETETITVTKTVLETEFEKKETWPGEKEKFLQDGKWIYKFCQEKSIALAEFDAKAKEFLTDLELKEDYKPIKEIRSHFTNWFNVQKKQNGKTNHQSTSGNRKASGAEKFLQRAKEKFNTPGNEGG